ncbi:MAG: replication initiator protein A [Caulobacteraceae bacterium]
MTKEAEDVARSPLLPLRHSTTDLFVCDIFDAAPKADMASMEHPIFSLSTKPDSRIRRYEHGKHFVEITPSVKGLATVHDRDILIYCISHIIAAKNQGRPVSKTVKLRAHDFLIATNRVTSGEGYEGLKAALERLRGTGVSTNLITGGEEIFETFGLIDKAKIVRQTRDGRMTDVEITLSDWVFNAIDANEVLTLNRDYFRLRKPLERRMYELARKHCGQQRSWAISLPLLQKKCGSNSTEKEFRRLVRAIIEQDESHQHLPDYSVGMADDLVTFTKRLDLAARSQIGGSADRAPQLDPEVLNKARKAAPGYDVQGLYRDWVGYWRDKGSPTLQSPEKAFLGFCRERHKRAPIR